MRFELKCWLPCIIAGLLTMVVFRVVLLIGIVPSSSMEPLIPAGSVILADRTAYWNREPVTGEVIVFGYKDTILIKRIAATAGETVIHSGKVLLVPDGCFYVLGDNQNSSIDSSVWNEPFISAADVIGRLIFFRHL